MFTKYENGAEVDITEVYRYDKETEAEVEAEAVYEYEDGAEVEVWGGSEPMYWYFENDNREYNVNSGSGGVSCQVSKGSTDFFYVVTYQGEFVNPTIAFSYASGAWDGEGYVVAGTLMLVGITSSGSESTVTIGTMGSEGDDVEGDVSQTLSGTFEQVGIKMLFRGSSDESENYFAYLDMHDITINGDKYSVENKEE